MFGPFRKHWGVSAGLCTVALAAAFGATVVQAQCVWTPGMPEQVLSLRQKYLPRQEYERLTREWREYLAAHPKCAIGYLNLERALSYSGADVSYVERLEMLRKARDIDPDCPSVLDRLSHYEFNMVDKADAEAVESSQEFARRALSLAPNDYGPHITLWTGCIVTGRVDEAQQHMREALRKGAFPTPLLDMAHNMLMSADTDAIVITNGDNDTFPLLALQAAQGIRRDVRVLNLSMSNIPQYATVLLAGKDGPLSKTDIDAAEKAWKADPGGKLLSNRLVERLIAKRKNGELALPLYATITVYPTHIKSWQTTTRLEGLLWRLGEEGVLWSEPEESEHAEDDLNGINVVKTDSLLHNVFRMQSVNDLGFPWGEHSSISMLMANYLGIARRLANAFAIQGDIAGVRRSLRTALDILVFHDELRQSDEGDRLVEYLKYWRKVDPGNPEIDSWEQRRH